MYNWRPLQEALSEAAFVVVDINGLTWASSGLVIRVYKAENGDGAYHFVKQYILCGDGEERGGRKNCLQVEHWLCKNSGYKSLEENMEQ